MSKENKEKIENPEKEKKKSESKQEKKESPEDNVKELTNTIKHVQAEFENYRKRMEKAQDDFRKFACKDVIIKLLTILDNFELALKTTEKNDDFTKGIEMIYAQFVQMLDDFGVQPIDALEKEFNPHYHEALLTEESEKKNIVLEEIQKGYTMHGTVLRHAKVKIGK